MPSLAEEAEYRRLAMAAGLVSPSEVVSWADAMILRVEIPSPALIGVSTGPTDDLHEMAHRLADLAGGLDDAGANRAKRRVLGLLHRRLATGQLTHAEVATAVYNVGSEARSITEEEKRFFLWVDYEFALVEDGLADEGKANEALESFLEDYAPESLDA
jgi:hypothetical protein